MMMPAKLTMQVGASLALALLTFLLGVGFRYESLPFPPESEFSDSAISRYPDALYFQRSIRESHTLPLWNNHLMGGQPFAANPGTKFWYPLTWLLVVWKPAFHINIMIFFHLWWGGVGMWLWSRASGLAVSGALLATVGYTFAPKLMAHAGAGHLDLLIAMAWTPWLLYEIRLATQQHFPTKVMIGMAFVGSMIFIGAIQIVPFVFGWAAIYYLTLAKDLRKALLTISISGLIFLGMSAVQWVPLVELRNTVSRGDIRESDAALFSLKPAQVVGFLIGDHGGNPETTVYAGVSLITLAILGLLLRPRTNRLIWATIVITFLYALGENFFFWKGLVRLIDPLLYFRVPSRAWFLGGLLLPYLAGWGLQYFLEDQPQSSKIRLAVVGFFGWGFTCSLASWVMLSDALATAVLMGLFALPVTALLMALYVFGKVPAYWVAAGFIFLVAIDCLWIDQSLIEGRAKSEWLSTSPPEEFADLTGRIYTPSYTIGQQETAYWHISRLDGVDPFQIGQFVQASESFTGVPLEGYSTTVPAVVVLVEDETSTVYQSAPINPAQLGAWGVEFILTNYPIQIDGLNLISQKNERYVYRNTLAWQPEEVQLTWESPNRIHQMVNSEREIHTVTNAPGWRRADGTPINHDLLSLPTETGTFIYRPLGIYIGMGISVLSYLLVAIWMMRTRYEA